MIIIDLIGCNIYIKFQKDLPCILPETYSGTKSKNKKTAGASKSIIPNQTDLNF